MTTETEAVTQRVRELVDEYRATCLWFFREDYYPSTVEEILRVLDAIAGSGDVEAFRKAEALRTWVSPRSS